MISMPKEQYKHNYIDRKIMPWIDLHFPADSSFDGRIVLCYRRKDNEGIYNVTRSDISKLADFVSEMHISRNVDYYTTANSVCGVRRVTEDVFGLHNIVIDIDCHSEKHNSSELLAAFIWRCSRDLWNAGECPEPNSIVFSGRGVQLWWAIEPASAKIQYWYKRMQAWLLDALQSVLDENPEQFEDISLDRSASVRLAGLFRLPLTYNTKTGRKGSLQILRRERYSLRGMIEQYVPAEYNPNKQSRSMRPQWSVKGDVEKVPDLEHVPLADRDAEVIRGGSNAMAARVHQLIRLRAMRNAAMGHEMRDRFCFTVYCALLANHKEDEAWNRLLAFNEGFKEPLELSALQQMMSSATERKYRLTNTWVIGELQINEDEQQAIGLFPTSAESARHKAPNYNRDLIRKTVKQDRNNKILAMFSDGVSKSQIARELEISWNTVSRVILDEQARMVALRASQDEAEAALMEEPVAAGAEMQTNKNLNEGKTSSKMVLNNIVFYGEASPALSLSGVQPKNKSGNDPPS